MDSNSNSTQQAEELESIQAIYCKPQEFNSWEAPEGQYVTIRFDFTLPPKKGVQRGGIHALLTSDYPLSSPTDMDVFCDNNSIPASSLHSYKLKMEERAEALKGEPMLLDLLCFVQELFESSADINDSIHDCDKLQKHDSSAVSVLSSEGDELKILSQSSSSATLDDSTKNHVDISLPPSVFHTKPNTRSIEDVNPSQRCKLENEDSLVTTLLHLDHMRSKRNYVKLIQKWTLELGLNGRLLFYGRFIFIVLQGHPHQVKEYILRNKTMIVDVDSKGRPCKERMLSVLCEVTSEKYLTFKEFTTVDNISSFDDFSAMFQSFSMMDVFNEHIEPVCSVKSKKASLRK